MLNAIRNAIARRGLLAAGQHVLVAVSGGADSVALLLALQRLAPRLGLRLTVAHLNHRLRGKDADADAAFVQALARRSKVPCIVARCDVRRLARRRHVSIEMAAREARYAFLLRTARRVRADAAATGHTADDVVETILLRLTRGAGPRGLAGIAARAEMNGLTVVRPLLDVTHKQTEAFLRANRCPWREDATNRDTAFLRNRVRHEILPLLEARLNPAVREALARTAAILRDEDEWMDRQARSILSAASGPGGCRGTAWLAAAALAEQPVAARRRVLRLWFAEQGLPADAVDFESVARADALLRTHRGTRVVELAGGWRVRRGYDGLSLERTRRRARGSWRVAVKAPGVTVLRREGLRIVTRLAPGIAKPRPSHPGAMPACASLSVRALARQPLYCRSWRAGDRMRPLGLGGSKKLQDIFVDAKVPAAQRRNVPVFESGGRIAWLPGYRVAEGWEVRDLRSPALQIRVERLTRSP